MCIYTSAAKNDDIEGRNVMRAHGVHFDDSAREHRRVLHVQDEKEVQSQRVLKRISDKANERERAWVAFQAKRAEEYARARAQNPKTRDLYPKIRVPKARTFRPTITYKELSVEGTGEKLRVPKQGKVPVVGIKPTNRADWNLWNRQRICKKKAWDDRMMVLGRDAVTGAMLPDPILEELKAAPRVYCRVPAYPDQLPP